MMKRSVIAALAATLVLASEALAQQKLVTGNVRREGVPLAGVIVVVKGTAQTTQTNGSGDYRIRANVGQVLQFRRIGYLPEERPIGDASVINVSLDRPATGLDRVVVTALGQQTVQRNLGTSQQTVTGADVAQTGRENFVNRSKVTDVMLK